MKVIEITGNADDLFCVSKEGKIKSVSVVQLPKDDDEFKTDLDITLSSMSFDEDNYKHDVIDKVLGHKIKFTLEIVD